MSQNYSDRPNLVRVARAIAASKHPERTLQALETVLTAGREEVSTPEGMTNNERFNVMLNACENPRRVCNALLALAGSGTFAGAEEGVGGMTAEETRRKIAAMLEKIVGEALLNRIYRFVKYIYIHREGQS